MKKLLYSIFIIIFFSLNTHALEDGIYAKFKTAKGDIIAKLFYLDTPVTVINFVGLAEGSKKNSYKLLGEPYYDGLTFHRVIKDFMIQGGGPKGNGTGGPGYNFEDEISDNLKHNKAGILSMANAGPNTNGSQFFITHKATPWLDGKHTVFGEVISGIAVVHKINQGDKINSLEIIRIGNKAKNFKTDDKAFNTAELKIIEKKRQKMAKDLKKVADFVKNNYPNAQQTESGLYYIVLKEGSGKKPKKGDLIKAHYDLKIAGKNKKIADSRSTNKPLHAAIGVGRLIKAWDEAVLDMKVGERRIIIAPYFLAYGEQGRGKVIPPKSTLIFDLELLVINPSN